MFEWRVVLLAALFLCRGIPLTTAAVCNENCTKIQPKAGWLPVTDFIKILQTSVEEDFEIFNSSLFPLLTEGELLDRAQKLWDEANIFEYQRACRGETEDNQTYPFLIFNTEEGKSGYKRKQSIESKIPGDVRLYSVLNTKNATAVFASLHYCDAINIDAIENEGDMLVQPFVMSMKMARATVQNLEDMIKEVEEARRRRAEAQRDLDGTDDETNAQYPGVDMVLCPGILPGDSAQDQESEDLTSNMTEFFLGTTTIETADGKTVNVSSVTDSAYFTKVNYDAIIQNITNTSNTLETLTEQATYWSELFEKGLTSGVCDDTIRNRLRWTLVRGLSEEDVSSLNVEFNDTGTNPIEDVCAKALVGALAVMPQICSLELRQEVKTDNDIAQYMVQSGYKDQRPWFDTGLDGKGQVIGVSDTGVDNNNCYFYDSDDDIPFGAFPSNSHRKIVQYQPVSGQSYYKNDYKYGHGTHVAGTIVGRKSDNGVNEQTGMADGVARAAKVAFYDFGDSQGNLNLPASDYEILEVGTLNDPPARIHSASWGSTARHYTFQAKNFDQYMYQNPNFLILVAAGNDGDDDSFQTVGSPATGKNLLAVGASHSNDDDLKSGQLGPSYVADFSSRGPVQGNEGRIKPDLVAPGKYILSAGALPDQSQECDPGSRPGAGQSSGGLSSKAGTSMATPVTSGTAALIRQYFEEGYYPTGEKNSTNAFTPSGALVKAVLLNGAQAKNPEDIRGVDNGNNNVNTDVKAYDYTIGFGRLSLIDSLYLPRRTNIQAQVWDQETVTDGGTKTYSVTIDKSNGCESNVFSTTLAWIERGSTPGCTECVLNDLDLTVIRKGTTYFPNGRTSKDEKNIVERVRIEGTANGDIFEIKVVGANLDWVSQKFSLVATGCFGGVKSELTGEDIFQADDSEDDKNKTLTIVFSVLGGVVGLCLLCLCFKYMQNRREEKQAAEAAEAAEDKNGLVSSGGEFRDDHGEEGFHE